MQPVKKNLLLLTLFSMCLVGARLIKTHEFSFVFLFWNLFLAFVPFWISSRIQQNHKHCSKLKLLAMCMMWLLFLPNAPYMVTDLFHFHKRDYLPVWFDLILILSFALNGLYLFFLSITHLYDVIASYRKGLTHPVYMIALFALVSYGVYIGRFLRLNSWDILNPWYVAKTCLLPLQNLHVLKDTMAFVVVFTFFLIAIHIIIKPALYAGLWKSNKGLVKDE